MNRGYCGRLAGSYTRSGSDGEVGGARIAQRCGHAVIAGVDIVVSLDAERA
jgi:hypothetical protein